MKVHDQPWGFIVWCLYCSVNSIDRECMLLDGDRISTPENLLNFTTLDCPLRLSISTFRGNLVLVEGDYINKTENIIVYNKIKYQLNFLEGFGNIRNDHLGNECLFNLINIDQINHLLCWVAPRTLYVSMNRTEVYPSWFFSFSFHLCISI